jgi:hypothetical protein
MDFNKPFKLTLEHYGTSITVEVDHSDVDLEEVMRLFRSLLIAAGFPKSNIDFYLNEEE